MGQIWRAITNRSGGRCFEIAIRLQSGIKHLELEAAFGDRVDQGKVRFPDIPPLRMNGENVLRTIGERFSLRRIAETDHEHLYVRFREP